MLCTVVLTHSSPFWCSELHPLMPSSCHLQSSFTNARLGPPFLPEFTTLIQWPSKFMGMNWCTHSDASKSQADQWCKSLAPMYAGQPVVMYDILCTGSGSLPLWYVSCQKTATKCAPVKAGGLMPYEMTPSWMQCQTHWALPQLSHQPHHRLLLDCAFLCHCLHLPSLHNYCSLCLLHLQHLWLQNHIHQLSLKSPLCLCLCLWHPA